MAIVQSSSSDVLSEYLKRKLLPASPAASRSAPTATPVAPTPAKLSEAQREEVRVAALKSGQALGLPAARAELLANAIVGVLAGR